MQRGRVEQGKYETSIHLKEIGMISGADMTTEATLVKLMFLLGQRKSNAVIKKQMQTKPAWPNYTEDEGALTALSNPK
jgi:L-asparaginase/Glu-tRNA(Gln) amidotransferase subunit D